MRKSIKLLAMGIAALLVAGSASKAEAGGKLKYTSTTEYNAESLAKGAEGINVVRLYGRAETEEAAIEDAKMKAVACALFCGFPSGANGSEAAPAIITDPNVEKTHKKFLEEFFKKGGDYLKYVKVSELANSKSSSKVSRTEFKVGVGLDVSYNALKEEMKKQGLVK